MNRWESMGDKYLLNALGADPYAASQSVAMYLDPVAKCIEWHTNGHVIRMRPDLPSAIVSGPFATSFGYEWNLAGGLVFGIGDASLTKRAGILDSWGIEGMQIYYIVPVGQIPDTPTIKIEKIDILDGMIDQLSLAPQGLLSAEETADGNTRTAPWVDESMVLSWANKSNNRAGDNHSNYMASKLLHKAPPLAHPLVCADLQAGNTSNRSFGAAGGSETRGWYEVLPGGFQKAYDRQTLADRRGVGTHYAFAATLGYTTLGGSNFGSNGRWQGGGAWLATEAGTITSLTVAIAGTVDAMRLGIYTDTDTNMAGAALVHDSGLIEDPIADPAAPWYTVALSKPQVSGQYYFNGNLQVFDDEQIYYDSGITGPWTIWRQASLSALAPLPNPSAAVAVSSNIKVSGYHTYSAGGGGIIPQIMHNRQLQRRR